MLLLAVASGATCYANQTNTIDEYAGQPQVGGLPPGYDPRAPAEPCAGADALDNNVLAANPTQIDADGDAYANACDADLNNDCIVNPIDPGLFRNAFCGTNPNADLNGDGVVNPIDLGILRSLFFGVPGPSGSSGLCDRSNRNCRGAALERPLRNRHSGRSDGVPVPVLACTHCFIAG